MNKKKNSTEFAEALDRRLSGLQGDPWLAQRIIANEEEKPVVTCRQRHDTVPCSILRAKGRWQSVVHGALYDQR